jgi:exosortase A-associated hydrolase 2
LSEETLTAQFLDTACGRIFVVLRRPPGAPRACVLVVAPFAEEMNKSRRMITLLAAQLAQRGVATVIVDPFGTGDSEGEFEAADWQRWKQDLRDAAQWCESQGARVTSLLGIRLGCALAAEFANESLAVSSTVFWQPVLDGSRFLDQFLRMRVAASMMEADNRESTADLRRRFAAGESLEVAGYMISARLAAQLDQVRLPPQLTARLGQVHWHEVVRAPDVPPPAVSTRAVEQARAAGLEVNLHAIGGEPFWSSVEIVTNTVLVEQSAAALAGQQ